MTQNCHIFYKSDLFDPRPIWNNLRWHAGENRWDAQRIINDLSNFAIAIDVRGRMVRAAVSDSRKRIKTFLSSINDNELANNMAYPEENMTYGLLFSLEAVIFESRGLKELLQKFYVGLLRKTQLANSKTANQEFDRLVTDSEDYMGFAWNKSLQGTRNFFSHESAPYPRIRYTSMEMTDRTIVIEHNPDSENILTLPDIDTYLRGLDRLSHLCIQDIIERLKPPSA